MLNEMLLHLLQGYPVNRTNHLLTQSLNQTNHSSKSLKQITQANHSSKSLKQTNKPLKQFWFFNLGLALLKHQSRWIELRQSLIKQKTTT